MRSTLLLVAFLAAIKNSIQVDSLTKEDGIGVRASALDKDFEDGRLSPWYDTSANFMHWLVEDSSTPLEPTNPAPPPLNSGTKYIRAGDRAGTVELNSLILRSPEFVAVPGDEVSFSFWIRSRRLRGNSLQLVMEMGLNETVLADVSIYSTSSNQEWNVEVVPIPVTAPTTIVLFFYGICGTNPEDAIAIDDILVGPISSGGSTTMMTSISTGPTTTPIPIDCGTDGDFPKDLPYCGPEFYRCRSGVGSLETCPDGTFFDSTTSVCVQPTESQCYKDFRCPPGSPTGFLPLYPEACTIYYFTCFNGGTFPQTCTGSAIFNPTACLCESAELCTPAQNSDVCNPARFF